MVKKRLAFRSALFIPLFVGGHCPGTTDPEGQAQTAELERLALSRDAVVLRVRLALWRSSLRPMGVPATHFHPCSQPISVVSGARASHERKMPKRVLSPSKIQTLKSHTWKELCSKEEWETGNMISVLTFGS